MTKTTVPLRLPFSGGLTDVPPFTLFVGHTVSATISLSITVKVSRAKEKSIVVNSPSSAVQVSLTDPLIEAVLSRLNPLRTPLRIEVHSDVPRYSGLGSSGALVVALIASIARERNLSLSTEQIIRMAHSIEVEQLRCGGYHDAVICSLGGLRAATYYVERWQTTKLHLPPQVRKSFHLFIRPSGNATTPTITRLTTHFSELFAALMRAKKLSYKLEHDIISNAIVDFGTHFSHVQSIKNRLIGTENSPFIVDITNRAASVGASIQLPGGKIGASLLVYAPDVPGEQLAELFPEFTALPFTFVDEGLTTTKVYE